VPFSLPKLDLPQLQFTLPDALGRANAQHYQGLTAKLAHLAQHAGTDSVAFRQRMQDFQAQILKGRRGVEIVRTAKDIRVLATLWQDRTRSGCQKITLAIMSSEGVPCLHGHALLLTIGTLGTDAA
jgi:hypothetical protein